MLVGLVGCRGSSRGIVVPAVAIPSSALIAAGCSDAQDDSRSSQGFASDSIGPRFGMSIARVAWRENVCGKNASSLNSEPL